MEAKPRFEVEFPDAISSSSGFTALGNNLQQ